MAQPHQGQVGTGDSPKDRTAISRAVRSIPWFTSPTMMPSQMGTEPVSGYPWGRVGVCAREGVTGKVCPWGDEFKRDGQWMTNSHQGHFPNANTREDGYLSTSPLARFPPNGYGLFDVAVNVWEWTSDWYRPDYYAKLAGAGGVARSPQGPDPSFDPSDPTEKKRVHRGGSFLRTKQYCSQYMVGTRGKGEGSTGTNH